MSEDTEKGEDTPSPNSAVANNPPGVLMPRRHGIKRFNGLAPASVGFLAAVVLGGLVYEFTLTQRAIHPKTEREAQEGHRAETAEIMSKAPKTDLIPASSGTAVPTAIVDQQGLPPPQPGVASQPEPGMTHAEIEGRRQIWNSYFQALDSERRQHLTAVTEALSADTETASPTGRPQDGRQGALQGGGGDQRVQDAGDDGASPGAPQSARPTSWASGTSGSGGVDTGRGRGFFDQPGATAATDYLHTTVTDPISPYELKATDIIDGRMISGLTSDSHGVVRAMVSKNVYDHATGLHILIPQGSQLKGVYNTGVSYGQKRVEVAWQRVIYPPPCDQSLDLGQMPGSDQSGYSGFHDITDNHYTMIFLNALLLSAFSAAAQVSQQGNYSGFGGYNAGQVAAGAVGQQLATLGEEFARRGLDVPPTEKVRNGYPFTIMITKDIAFAQPWVAGQCGSQEVTVAQR